MSKRKLGRFRISMDFMKNLHEGEGSNLFSDMFVLRAQEDYINGWVEYVGIHKDFAVVPEGQMIPLYYASFEKTVVKPTWVKVE